jgi:protein arginine kinase
LDWPELAAAPLPWVRVGSQGGGQVGGQASAVVFTRVLVFRNFSDLPFVVSAPPNACQAAADRALDRIAKRGGSEVSRLSDLPPRVIRLLREREILPPRAVPFPGKKAFKFVALAPEASRWTLVNEVEHVTFGRLFAGSPAPEAFADAYADAEGHGPFAEEAHRRPWAWSPAYGYLASDPSRIGPGLSVELVAHLPGLGITRQLPSARNYLSAAGAGFSPMETGSPARSGPADVGLFRMVFRGKLGKTAKEVYASVLETVEPLLRREYLARNACLEKRRKRLEDRLEHSLLLLSGSASVTYPELLAASSFVRLGACLGMVNPQFAGILEELRVRTASGHLAVSSGKDLSQEEEDFSRANVVRSYLEARSGEIH